MNISEMFLLALFQGFLSLCLCQNWEFVTKIEALNGSCVEIPCIYSVPREYATSRVVWYLYDRMDYIQIYNDNSLSSVRRSYRSRTSLVPIASLAPGIRSCTLRIDRVRKEDEAYYYPGISAKLDKNAYNMHRSSVLIQVSDTPRQIEMNGPGNMKEGDAVKISCTTYHTCGSSPPSLEWNKPGETRRRFTYLSNGIWLEESQLTYIPYYVDDKTILQCKVTYPSGLAYQAEAPLNIKYSPNNVAVILKGNKEIIEGSDVILSCSSKSNPNVHLYEWYKGEQKVKLTAKTAEIEVENMTWDTEPYSCAAVNEVGRGESKLTQIPVQYTPRDVHIKKYREEDAIILMCCFRSSRPDVSHYSWMKDHVLLENESGQNLTLYTDDLDVTVHGSYSCVAHNSVGNSTSELNYITANDDHTKSSYLTPILWSLGGILILFLLMLTTYFYIRRKRQSAHEASPIIGASTRMPFPHIMDQEEGLEQAHEYGNIEHKSALGSSQWTDDENNAIYSNTEAFLDVEYSAVSHGQARPTQPNVYRGQDVEYATVR